MTDDEVATERLASAVAELLADVADRFVLDEADAAEQDAVRVVGIETGLAPTLVHLDADAVRSLIPTVLDAVGVTR